MPRALPADREKELIDRYGAGESTGALAESFGVAIQTVYNALGRAGIKPKGVGKRTRSLILRAVKSGRTRSEAAEKCGVSESTVARVVRERRQDGEAVGLKRGRPRRDRVLLVVCPPRERVLCEVDDALVERVYAVLRERPFPYPEMLAPDLFAHEVARLRALKTWIIDGEIRPWNSVGVRVCSPFFSNRYAAISKGEESAEMAWRDERLLKRAIRFQIRHGDPTTPNRVLRAITLRSRTPTIFRPAVARFICERYCPSGGVVWDPCAGYGGRLLGAHAAGVRYIGTDVEPRAVDGNLRLASALGFETRVECVPAETFEPPAVDLVFTSPPYFDRERYSHGAEQSWRRYRNLDGWIAGFMRPVVKRAHGALRGRGHLVLNVADLNERGTVLPIVALTIQAALDAGFVHVETLQMPLASINRVSAKEPVLVFQKP